MCGIFFALSNNAHLEPDTNTRRLLENRGPDATGLHRITLGHHQDRYHATFLSTVLSLRGTAIVDQPLKDDASGSVLCWNGEAWSIRRQHVTSNDSQAVFALLLEACAGSAIQSTAAVVNLLSSIRGPYAFVFYDAVHHRVYYGRDCLGRRSLLRKSTQDNSLVLSSVCDNASGDTWAEVEADGIYACDLNTNDPMSGPQVTHIPHVRSGQLDAPDLSFTLPFPSMNRSLPKQGLDSDDQNDTIQRLKDSLSNSLKLRIQHVREAVPGAHEQEARIAVLFSGGLDCTILARLCHDLLPLDQSIDLLNVAFENPRIHSKLQPGESPYELCPDRITGRASHAELQEVCPGRQWRFVEINVPYTQTVASRDAVMALMHPHNTEMDLSISYALHFASQGVGTTFATDNTPQPYTTTSHVLLSGLGADELFGGYQRHATAYARRGYPGLIEELELDFDRLGKRNLGRDDRVISDSNREVRFPFLDEDFIALALTLPVTAKCDFGVAEGQHALEPGKRALRLLAWDLGMQRVATEKKRAIQFGARTAKMETGKTKGTHVLS